MTENQTFKDAELFCRQNRAHLVTVFGEAEMTYLTQKWTRLNATSQWYGVHKLLYLLYRILFFLYIQESVQNWASLQSVAILTEKIHCFLAG